MSVQKRREELTALNLLFCFMVLWSHCSGHPITVLDHSSWQYGLMISLQRLSFVSVSGFFFLSGVKLTLNSASTPPPSLRRYWAKRVKAIFLPYLLAVAVYYVYFVGRGYFPFSLGELAGYAIRGDLSASFYFVIALAQFVLLVPLFRWLPRRWSPLVLLPISLGITWLSALYCNEILGLLIPGAHFSYNDRLFTTYLVYYVGGCCAGQNYPRFLELLDRNRPLLTACALFFAGADLFFSWKFFVSGQSVPFLEMIHTLYQLTAIPALFAVAVRHPVTLSLLARRMDRASFSGLSVPLPGHHLVQRPGLAAGDRAGVCPVPAAGGHRLLPHLFRRYVLAVGACSGAASPHPQTLKFRGPYHEKIYGRI